MKTLVLLVALLAAPAMAAEEFRDAIVVNSGIKPSGSAMVLPGGVIAAENVHSVTVQIDGMLITGAWSPMFGKNSAGQFIVGDVVKARFVGHDKLQVQVPGGDAVRTSIVKRERL